MKNNNDISYINVLNVLSALAVVFLHVNNCFWNYQGGADLSWWKSANVIESLFYFAVPVFFMITGATLLDFYSKYGIREYVIKRVNKTFIPYVVWSVIGLLINVYILELIPINDIGIRFIIKGLIENSFVGVYWFFTALFCVYFCIPLLAAVNQKQKITIYTFTLVLAGIVNIIIPFIFNVFSLDIKWNYQVLVSSGYLFYILVGYVISKIDFELRTRILLYGISIIGLLLHILGTYYLSKNTNMIIQVYKGYNNLPCVLYSVGVFVFIKSVSSRFSDKVLSVFRFLSKYTFGVYLIHIFIIRGFEKLFMIDTTNIYYRLAFPPVVFAVAVFFCYILKKIPFIKRIVP